MLEKLVFSERILDFLGLRRFFSPGFASIFGLSARSLRRLIKKMVFKKFVGSVRSNFGLDGLFGVSVKRSWLGGL
jgi:hypothetical protein